MPAAFTTGQVPTATQLNNAINETYSWQDHVAANAKNLSNLGTVTFNAAGGFSGNIPITGPASNGVNALSFGVRRSADGSGSLSIGTTGSHNLRLMTNAADVVHITASGLVGIGLSPTHQLQLSTDSAGKPSTSTWTVVSDIRTKREIEPLTGALDKIRALEVIEYIEGETNERTVGVSAQQLQTIMPEAVVQTQGEVAGVVNPLAVSHHHINMLTASAVKELAAAVAALTARIAALEARGSRP
jgi:hypothetical protein